jgi:bifunctional UDP-N-acetylglucosamine pyrophosphorylase/glucosamine-1-phosphate N-acetyltransferase
VGFARQNEQRGTGHAVMAAREKVEALGGLVLVLYGDAPLLSEETLRRLVAAQEQGGRAATVITTVLNDPTGYGRVLVDPSGDIAAIVEQKAATEEQRGIREINSGIYCFRSSLLWRHLDEIGINNPAGEYYLTDMVEILRRHGHRVGRMVLDPPDEVLGINTRVELAEVDRLFRGRTTLRWMLEGVTIEKPETVLIDSQVTLGRDTVIGPFAQVLGKTTIGEDCRIGACSIVADSTLADGVEIAPFTLVEDAEVEAGALIGPYARLRPGNHVGAKARIGNFVELKKTKLGAGSKANHLAYLGDTTIGEGVNVGAGTITCNYDGAHKYPTRIGDGAFVGSNSTLVAPIEIGAGSYIAAGSVITEAIPADALAVGRGRQVNKEGWAARRRGQRAK